MSLEKIVPGDIRSLYEVHEWRNASAILSAAHENEWAELLAMLRGFHLYASET